VPENLEIIAVAPAAFGEQAGAAATPRSSRPRTSPSSCARCSATPARRRSGGCARPCGDGLVPPRRGEVFNGGTTEWGHGLAARDPFIERITRNVLTRFGAY